MWDSDDEDLSPSHFRCEYRVRPTAEQCRLFREHQKVLKEARWDDYAYLESWAEDIARWTLRLREAEDALKGLQKTIESSGQDFSREHPCYQDCE